MADEFTHKQKIMTAADLRDFLISAIEIDPRYADKPVHFMFHKIRVLYGADLYEEEDTKEPYSILLQFTLDDCEK